MLNPLERDHLIQLRDNGAELSDEAITLLMQADEAELDKLIEFIGEDDE